MCARVFVRAGGKLSSGTAGLTIPGEDVISVSRSPQGQTNSQETCSLSASLI